MTTTIKKLAKAGVLVIAALGATPAFAAGTDTNAGTAITNTASVSYSVNAVTGFSATSNSDVINVDRKVTLLVSEVGTATVNSVLGSTAQVTTFTVNNTTNGAIDVLLSAANLATGQTAPGHPGTDALTVSNFVYYVESNGTAGLQTGVGGDTLASYVDELAEDATVTVYVLADMPTAGTNGQVAAISLTGTAALPGTVGTAGAALANDSAAANTAAVQNVFNDAAGTDDLAKDGKSSARDDYTLQAPTLAVSKISWVISDPVSGVGNGTTIFPKMIPGAVVGYCITVTNTGPTAADAVSVTDNLTTLPVAYTASSAQVIAAGPSGGTCSGTGAGGSFAGSTVTGALGTVPATTGVKSVWFTVTIN
jgi:hypothetical protein